MSITTSKDEWPIKTICCRNHQHWSKSMKLLCISSGKKWQARISVFSPNQFIFCVFICITNEWNTKWRFATPICETVEPESLSLNLSPYFEETTIVLASPATSILKVLQNALSEGFLCCPCAFPPLSSQYLGRWQGPKRSTVVLADCPLNNLHLFCPLNDLHLLSCGFRSVQSFTQHDKGQVEVLHSTWRGLGGGPSLNMTRVEWMSFTQFTQRDEGWVEVLHSTWQG